MTKSQARSLVQRIAYVLRNEYGIGGNHTGRDIVLATSCGNPFIPVIFYAIVAAGGVYSGASTAFRPAELARQMKDAGDDLSLLMCSTEYEESTVRAANESNFPVERVLVLDYSRPGRWTLRRSLDKSDVLALHTGKVLDWERITNLK